MRFVLFLQAIVDMLESRTSPVLKRLLSEGQAHGAFESIAKLSAVKNAGETIPQFQRTFDSAKKTLQR